MENYYVYAIFLPLLSTGIVLFPLTLSIEYRKGGTVTLMLLLILRALAQVCPYEGAAGLFRTLSPFLIPLPPLLLLPRPLKRRGAAEFLPPLTAALLLILRFRLSHPWDSIAMGGGSFLLYGLFRRDRSRKSPWSAHEGWIASTLRESVMLFDRNLKVISGGKDVFPPYLIPPGRSLLTLFLSLAGPETDLEDLKRVYNGEREGSGLIRLSRRYFSFRFIPLDRSRGYLLTLLDVTAEQELVGQLSDQNRILRNRKTILQSDEGRDGTLRRKEEGIRAKISGNIQKLVEEQLTRLRENLGNRDTSEENLNRLLTQATTGMAAIRRAVSELREDHNES